MPEDGAGETPDPDTLRQDKPVRRHEGSEKELAAAVTEPVLLTLVKASSQSTTYRCQSERDCTGGRKAPPK